MASKSKEQPEPAAIVIGANLNALGVCRNLGQNGVRTYALSDRFFDPAMWSRYAKPLAARGMHDQELIDTLLTLPEEVGERPVLIITDEMSLITISERREEILNRFRLHLPTHETLLTLQDKVQFHEFAMRVGLPVPKSVVLRQIDDVEKLRTLEFPIVLKPSNKRPVHLKRVPRLVVARTWDHAARAFSTAFHRTEIIAQEWVEGPDTEIYFCLFYCGDHQTVMFSGQKLASSPPGTGTTALCIHAGDLRETIDNATRQFLEAVPEFRGFGSVEFKWDAATQRWVIIEPTVGRTDWQEEIATLLGVNLPLVGYLCECDRPLPEMNQRADEIVWQSSYLNRWKVGSSTIPANATVVDGFWRRDDPRPAIIHYPLEFLSIRTIAALVIAVMRFGGAPESWGWWQLRKSK